MEKAKIMQNLNVRNWSAGKYCASIPNVFTEPKLNNLIKLKKSPTKHAVVMHSNHNLQFT